MVGGGANRPRPVPGESPVIAQVHSVERDQFGDPIETPQGTIDVIPGGLSVAPLLDAVTVTSGQIGIRRGTTSTGHELEEGDKITLPHWVQVCVAGSSVMGLPVEPHRHRVRVPVVAGRAVQLAAENVRDTAPMPRKMPKPLDPRKLREAARTPSALPRLAGTSRGRASGSSPAACEASPHAINRDNR